MSGRIKKYMCEKALLKNNIFTPPSLPPSLPPYLVIAALVSLSEKEHVPLAIVVLGGQHLREGWREGEREEGRVRRRRTDGGQEDKGEEGGREGGRASTYHAVGLEGRQRLKAEFRDIAGIRKQAAHTPPSLSPSLPPYLALRLERGQGLLTKLRHKASIKEGNRQLAIRIKVVVMLISLPPSLPPSLPTYLAVRLERRQRLEAKLTHKAGIGEGSRQLAIRIKVVVVQISVVQVTGIAPSLDVGVLKGGREGGREGGGL